MSTYAVLVETSTDDCQSVYYFIKKNGNEKSLSKLDNQLNMIEDMVLLDDVSVFDLDIKQCVSEKTAIEMCKLQVTELSHRKFDGVLQPIDFKFKRKDHDTHRVFRVWDLIGDGGISEFIDKEHVFENRVIAGSDSEGSDSELDADVLKRYKKHGR